MTDLRYQPPPLHVIPPPVRDFVEAHAEAIGIDAGFVLPATLAGLASAIGNTASIAVKPGWVEPCVVWATVVADSGSAKTPAMAGALQPIEDRAVHEPCMVKDITVEALADQLSTHPRNVLVYRDELDGWFGSFNQYKQGRGGDVAGWLEVWCAKLLMVNRKGAVPIKVPHAGVCVVGAIQPATLDYAMTSRHQQNGLAARLLWCMPPRRAKRWTENTVSDAIGGAYSAVFDRLYSMQMREDCNGQCSPRLLGLSQAARDRWALFVDEWGAYTVKREGPLAAAAAKIEAYAARLALVVHLAGSHEPAFERRVSVESIEAGIALGRWFANEADRVFAHLEGNERPTADERLMEWVRRVDDRATLACLHRSGPKPWRDDLARAEADVSRLLQSGRLVWHQPAQEGPGRPRAKLLRVVA